jgi:hypothetical protein
MAPPGGLRVARPTFKVDGADELVALVLAA